MGVGRDQGACPNAYPEATMFGKLPAHGLYCRHVRGLTLTDVRLLTDKPDERHALVLDDVPGGEHQRSVLFARRGRPVGRPHGSGPRRSDPRLSARGDRRRRVPAVWKASDTAGIALMGNDFSRVGKVAEYGEGVDPSGLAFGGKHRAKHNVASCADALSMPCSAGPSA